MENESIRRFVQKAADKGYLSDYVLDFGCGKQPYRGIVERAGGDYHGYDLKKFPGNMSGKDITPSLVRPLVATILCTQVVQYMPDVQKWLCDLKNLYAWVPKFHLVLTGPTNWPEVQDFDLHRFTRAGMESLLISAGFEVVLSERREAFTHLGYEWSLGFGIVARA
jgi:hypothetical protein